MERLMPLVLIFGLLFIGEFFLAEASQVRYKWSLIIVMLIPVIKVSGNITIDSFWSCCLEFYYFYVTKIVDIENLKGIMLVEFCWKSIGVGGSIHQAVYLMASRNRLCKNFIRLWKLTKPIDFTKSGDVKIFPPCWHNFCFRGSFGTRLIIGTIFFTFGIP